MKIVRGFTLIELVVTLVVTAILITIGIPSFEDFIKSNNIKANANTLLTDFHLARSEAVKRNGPVRICKSSDLKSCTSAGGWEQGWIIFPDKNKNSVVDNGEYIIRSNGPAKGYITMRGNTNVKDSLLFQSSGKSIVGSIIICDDRITDFANAPKHMKDKARVILISLLGRMRIVEGSDNSVSMTSCTPSQ